MYKESIKQKWLKWNKSIESFWSIFIQIAISLSFLVSDWVWGLFSFADYSIAIILISLVITGQFKIHKKQSICALLIIIFLLINLAYHTIMNEDFNFILGISSIIKILGYLLFVIATLNFIKNYSRETLFLKCLNYTAMLACVIGIYITIALYSDGSLPYRFLWEFTRYDIYSYFFESNPNIVRTRSLFSEPAHLGYFLNLILAVNFFNKSIKKVHLVFNVIISLTIFLTFSYSMIGIMMVIYFLKTIVLIKEKNIKWHSYYWIFVIGLSLVVLYFWDFIEITLIDRTISVLNGEDVSARMRIIDSWKYINRDNLLFGNGLGHTPTITNVYAYLVSDLGIFALLGAILFTAILLKRNFSYGIIFLALNVSRGGYLGPAFWILILVSLVFTSVESKVVAHKNTLSNNYFFRGGS